MTSITYTSTFSLTKPGYEWVDDGLHFKHVECCICNSDLWLWGAILPKCCQSKISNPNYLCSDCCWKVDKCPLCRAPKGLSNDEVIESMEEDLIEFADDVNDAFQVFWLFHKYCADDLLDDQYFNEMMLQWGEEVTLYEALTACWIAIREKCREKHVLTSELWGTHF